MKFAYLIMAHNRFDVLMELLKDLDDDRNDIYLHIDKKSKNIPLNDIIGCVKKSKLIILKPMKVYWGHSSQIRCVLNLLNEATKHRYDYYHMLVGVEYPLQNQDKIHDFFEANAGKEYIGFDLADSNYMDRIRYFHFFVKYARAHSKLSRQLYNWGSKLVNVQRRMGINRISDDIEYKKGYANWSITQELAEYIVHNKKFIEDRMQLTSCADEVLFHTLVYNSKFRDRINNYYDEYDSCKRITTWNNSKNRIYVDDVPKIMQTDRLFARKIDGEDALEVIECIKNSRIGC